jgi:hypothetical protein
VIIQEGAPGLRRRLAAPDHVLGHGGLADRDTQFLSSSPWMWGAPERGFSRHPPDQIADLAGERQGDPVDRVELSRSETGERLCDARQLRFRVGRWSAPSASQPKVARGRPTTAGRPTSTSADVSGSASAH